MNVTSITYQKVELQLSLQELKVFMNVFKCVQSELSEADFETRVGASYRQTRGFLETLIQDIEKSGESLITINFSLSEIFLLNNLLNEVCNGIAVHDFQTKIGMPKEEANYFLDIVHKAIFEIQSLREARKTSLMPSKSEFLTSSNNCCLESDGYRVTFSGLTQLAQSVGGQSPPTQ